MGTLLESLLRVQSIERQLSLVKRRLRAQQNAVRAQQHRLDGLREDHEALKAKSLLRRKEADGLDLTLKSSEENVAKLRTALNTTKTNKEYATLLMQINTTKADNAKVEEEALNIMQEMDAIAEKLGEVEKDVQAQETQLAEITGASAEESARLGEMLEDLGSQHAVAATDVPSKALAVFDRIAESYDGEAMAMIEITGDKPPFDYVCGGCFMSLNAEHANALHVRDEIRTCDNCGRILYVEKKAAGSPGE